MLAEKCGCYFYPNGRSSGHCDSLTIYKAVRDFVFRIPMEVIACSINLDFSHGGLNRAWRKGRLN